MSIWFQYSVTAIGDRVAIGNFFKLDPKEDIHGIEDFEFSFGQKNVPGLRLQKLVVQNPELIFLTKVSSDYDVVWYIEKFDVATDKVKHIFIERSPFDIECGGHEVNKLLLEEYSKQFHYLMDQHKNGRPYEWRSFFFNIERTCDTNLMDTFSRFSFTNEYLSYLKVTEEYKTELLNV